MSLDENPGSGKSTMATGDRAAQPALDAGTNAITPLDVDANAITPLLSPMSSVTLWWCTLDAPAAALPALEALLSDAERSRAARFGTAALRERYVVGRASLRRVLGTMLGLPPAGVPIVRGERGRPRLGFAHDHGYGGYPGHGDDAGHDHDAGVCAGAAALDFNISHTSDAAMIGVASGARIGVDIERSDRVVNVPGLARKFLSAAERSHLAALDPDDVRRRVLQLWTCKEAMSKATGDALSAPFAELTVDIARGPRLCDGPAPYLPARWELRSAAAPEAFFATVALWWP